MEAFESLCKAATGRPWRVKLTRRGWADIWLGETGIIADEMGEENARLAAVAVNHIEEATTLLDLAWAALDHNAEEKIAGDIADFLDRVEAACKEQG